MSDEAGKPGPNLREAMELEKARLLEQAERGLARARAIDQKIAKLAELEQLAAEFNYSLVAKSAVAAEPAPAAAKVEPVHNPQESVFDGTLAKLVRLYQSDPRSSYHQLRYHVRKNHDFTLDRIVNERGGYRVADLTKADLDEIYRIYSADGKKPAMGRLIMGKIRTIFAFGASILEDADCQRLVGIFQTLQPLHFGVPKARVQRLTRDQANDICAAARKKDWGSIALAQAIQFESELRQKDVIGEWVPVSEAGPPSEIIDDKKRKWLHGVRWSQVDENLILHHVTSFQGKEVKIDLKRRPMIMEELEHQYGLNRNGTPNRAKLPSGGPIIICEYTKRPWLAAEFRRKWRIVANVVGVPNTVKNMDSIRSKTGEEDRETGESDKDERQVR